MLLTREIFPDLKYCREQKNHDIVLDLAGVFKSFNDEPVIENFSLDVARGEFITLLGPSGCGKTTLLRMIAGFERPDSGVIRLDGADLVGLAPEMRQVNTVFQSYALFPHMTVYENIAFGLRVKRMPASRIREAVGKALEQTRLTELAQRKPAQLSFLPSLGVWMTFTSTAWS